MVGQQGSRGVVNGIGYATQFLFGTAADTGMQEVRVLLDEMSRKQDTTLHWIDQFTGAINHSCESSSELVTQMLLSAQQYARSCEQWRNDARHI